ncbi:hypothetical protein V8E51_018272 [Hyaloscypha variabilis]
MMACLAAGHSDCEGTAIAHGANQATDAELCPQDDTEQEPSPLESFSSGRPVSARPTLEADRQLSIPLDQSCAAAELPATTAADSHADDVATIPDHFTIQLFQSRAYTANTSNITQDDLEGALTNRTSSTNDADSSDDSDGCNEYSLTVKVQNLSGQFKSVLASSDTGAPTDFVFRSALNEIGAVEEIPIPERKLKAFTNPLDTGKSEVPKFYVRLPLYNREVGVFEVVRLKVFELPQGTNGYGIIFGRKFIRNHGGHRFLEKVEAASFADPRLAGLGDTSFGTLLPTKRTKEQKMREKQDNDKFREQTRVIASKLYASSGLGSSSAATSWAETAGRSHDPSVRSAGSAAWQPTAQQSNGSPLYNGARPGQQNAPNRNAPLGDLPGDWASRRTNTNNTTSTQFTQDSIFSLTRHDTVSTMSSCSSVPTVATAEEKVAGPATDYSVLQSRAACDIINTRRQTFLSYDSRPLRARTNNTNFLPSRNHSLPTQRAHESWGEPGTM